MLRQTQTLCPLALILSLAAFGTACGNGSDRVPAPLDAKDPSELDAPTEVEALDRFLELGSYLRWAAEPALHAGRGPHGSDVRVFYGAKAADALTRNAPEFPGGAAVIKEIRAENAAGWAVWVKAADDSDGGNAFYWYELIIGRDGTRKVYGDGFGVPGCVGCHSSGRDYLLADGTFE